ncbi:3-oxoacyl-ACP reductase [Achromobacter marplatensis]|uniref:NAD(P)-dependent dehydrogenase (Short-subunit alcohol dehydrogenase family) n=1 Tax=Achromobacter marplatensis TaxID=470868 RepID=A0ABX9G1S3_9BURK|nr:SDR family oxidoreductase [Achromobacter marplatensis]OWT56351.1 3-oxoacyl-ACP reductase [Achromobacter marplatensis]RBP12154.1 NAD(P)-dependent dehydrogenase (short-subunit alcohol dehydrogenase family) [Achromobacter marplatensis]CAB3708479.1 Levodione reductase [Achromobacter marplatensis]
MLSTSKPPGRVAGKVALVFGAGCVGPGWGNGRAIAVRLAQEGALVMAVDRQPDSLPETLEHAGEFRGNIETHICDVGDSGQVGRLVDAVHQRHGRIDVLVNNVGGPIPGGATALSEADWQRQLDLNLTSVFTTCRHVLALMARQGSGAVVNVSSTSAIRWTGAPQVGYAAAKAGVMQFGRVAAVEYARHGVRINTVLPGQLHTPLVDAFLATQQAAGDVQALLEKRQKRIPLPFMGDGRDTANAVLFLVSDEARFITGTELIVDGGMSARCD